MADESIWTTSYVIQAVIGTGIISALVSWALSGIADLVRAYRRKRDGRTYICMRIASVLESYAIECAEAIDAAEAYYGQTQIPAILSLPDTPVYPKDVDWHSLDSQDAYSVMSFLNECEAQAAQARYANHYEGNPFEGQEASKRTGKKAHELANKLRGVAKLQPPELGTVLQSLFK